MHQDVGITLQWCRVVGLKTAKVPACSPTARGPANFSGVAVQAQFASVNAAHNPNLRGEQPPHRHAQYDVQCTRKLSSTRNKHTDKA